MNSLKKLYTKAGQNPIKSAIIITVAAALVLFLMNRASTEPVAAEATKTISEVTISTAQGFAGGDSVSLLGNVRAFTEAAVTTERAGRVVRVNVTLGQTVGAGQVLATLENAAESASVVQAEGAYDAAVAAKAQALAADSRDTLGVDESQNTLTSAQNAVVNTYKSAYTTVNGIVLNNIDAFFTSPNGMVPGVRIDGYGQTSFLNSERVEYQRLLPNWQQSANNLTVNGDLTAALVEAESNVDRTLTLVDTFIVLFNRADSGRYTNAELQTFSTNFTSLRSSLLGTKSAIEAVQVGLKSAKDVGTRANISTSVSSVPAADAQIKQALGSLRAAQANYAKTILRTPISGTVNSLNIKQGDFVNSFVKVAEVANNNALEIVTFVSDKERDVLAVGDIVLIEGRYEGRITQIAPAIDSATRKTEVRIATENTNIKNGETVNISKEIAATETKNATVTIPLTAVKFEIKDGFVFDVVDGLLVQKPVKLGTIRGATVEIVEGLSLTDPFVVDARGLLVGSKVTITQ
jgi:multidrug efflux pump subunit AcrA (membrane-fusion protein)